MDASGPPPKRYAVLIDAGSSGSRIHVYAYTPPLGPGQYPDVVLPGRVARVTPGLSAFAPRGEGLEESLNPLIQFALEQVPPHRHASTPIRLLATAGLRMLPPQQQAGLLAAAGRLLAASGFAFGGQMASPSGPGPGPASGSGSGSSGEGGGGESGGGGGGGGWCRVLSGAEEGLFAWAGINYAAGTLQALAQAQPWPGADSAAPRAGPAPQPATLAVLELGGASMQLTLLPSEPLPPGLGHSLALPGVQMPLYTHSFLGYGLQVAWFREAMLVQGGGENATDPCLHPGYASGPSGVLGSGSFAACADLALQLLQQAEVGAGGGGGGGADGGGSGGCRFERCSIGGEYLPRLAPPGPSPDSKSEEHPGSGSGSGDGYLIMATESFYYTLDRLGLPPNASLAQLRDAGAAFCARPWADVEREVVTGAGVSEEYVLKVCFGSAYIYTLLTQAFRLGPREASRVRFTNYVTRPDGSQVEVNWVLGALLAEVVAGRDAAAAALPAVPTAASKPSSSASASSAAASASSAAASASSTAAASQRVRGRAGRGRRERAGLGRSGPLGGTAGSGRGSTSAAGPSAAAPTAAPTALSFDASNLRRGRLQLRRRQLLSTEQRLRMLALGQEWVAGGGGGGREGGGGSGDVEPEAAAAADALGKGMGDVDGERYGSGGSGGDSGSGGGGGRPLQRRLVTAAAVALLSAVFCLAAALAAATTARTAAVAPPTVAAPRTWRPRRCSRFAVLAFAAARTDGHTAASWLPPPRQQAAGTAALPPPRRPWQLLLLPPWRRRHQLPAPSPAAAAAAAQQAQAAGGGRCGAGAGPGLPSPRPHGSGPGPGPGPGLGPGPGPGQQLAQGHTGAGGAGGGARTPAPGDGVSGGAGGTVSGGGLFCISRSQFSSQLLCEHGDAWDGGRGARASGCGRPDGRWEPRG